MAGTRMRGTTILLLLTGLFAGSARALAAQQQPPREWRPHGRVKEYGRSLFGTFAIVGIGISAGIDQWNDSPEEWDDDWSGFGQRVLSDAGSNAVGQTVRHGLAALLDRSVTYQACACGTVGGRAFHAVKETVTDRDRDGHRWFSIPRFAGAFAGPWAESSWRPGFSGNDIFWAGTLGIGMTMAGNIFREFVGWPP